MTGTSTITGWDKRGSNGTMALQGQGRKDGLAFAELDILDQHKYSSFDWCIKQGDLSLAVRGATLELHGRWTGVVGRTRCTPGTITLRKTWRPHSPRAVTRAPAPERLQPRTVHLRPAPLPPGMPSVAAGAWRHPLLATPVRWYGRPVPLTSRSVTVELYDHVRYDGDRVALFLNGALRAELVLPPRTEPVALVMTLQPGVNLVEFHAISQGSEGPSTIGIRVDDGTSVQSLLLRAKAGTGAGVQLVAP